MNGSGVRLRSIARWVLIALAAVVLVAGIGFCVYTGDYYRADARAMAALESSDDVEVFEEAGYVTFAPSVPKAGFVFYPGGKVQAESYAPLMRECARHGLLCVIAKMPFNLAFFDTDAASGAIRQHPYIQRWYVGGHSLGGVAAASYAAGHGDEVEGVVFLASYSSDDLRGAELGALSICGSNDGVLNRESYEEAKGRLSKYDEVVIEGGNHAQFGDYGEQAGDGKASISPQEQQEQTANAIAKYCVKAGNQPN